MHLHLIRHGQSLGNVDQGFIAGRTDKRGLTPKGKAQITRTAWELRNTEFKTIYSSPVTRAKESATILSNLLDVPLKTLPFIQEMSYGDFEGEYFWVNMDKKREAFQRFNTEIDYAFPNGESLQMISDRVWEGWNRWIKTIDQNDKSNIIFVSHDAIISTLLFCLMYGHPTHKDATASYKDAYMQFVHKIDVPNGSAFVIDLHANPVRFHQLPHKTKEVLRDNDSICFYAKGMLGIDKARVEEKITASDNSVFHLSNSIDVILKIIKEQEIVSSERIVSIYKYLKKHTSLLVPEVILYDKGEAFYSDTVLIQDYVAGVDQSVVIEKDRCRKSLLELTNKLLEQIHAVSRKDVEVFWYPYDAWHKVHIPWEQYISEEIDETIEALPKSIGNRDVRSFVRMSLRRLKEYVGKKSAKLVPLHGDFTPANIVVTKDGTLRCLDFERARIGDILWDYAYYCGSLERADEKVAALWKQIVAEQFSPEEVKIFNYYCVLFHAWTIRDTFEYKKNTLRQDRALQSKEILLKRFNARV